MKILRRPGMPSGTKSLTLPEQREARRRAVEVIRAGRYDEEELEDALVLIGRYLWATPDIEEDVDDEEEDEEEEAWHLRSRVREISGRRVQAEKPWFIGRQVSAGDAGTLDLIGPQRDGRTGALTIYELKAREIRAADLAQVESYRVALEELSADDLAWAIATNSGQRGIPRNWSPEELRGDLQAIEDWALYERDDSDEDPDFRRIDCAVVGRAWKRPVSRLANSMGIKLLHIPDLIATALEEIAKAERDIARMEETQRRLEAISEDEEDEP